MKLFFRRYGDTGAQPLIILHGLFGLSDNWVTFGRRIADEGFDVVIPDQRNHGNSPHSDTFNYIALTEDLDELIEDLGFEQPALLGHSMGGKVSMRYAMERPEKVKKLLVADISPRSYGHRPQHAAIIEAMLAVDFEMVKSRSEVEAMLGTNINDLRIRQFIMKNLHWLDKDRLAWKMNLEGIRSNLHQMFDTVETDLEFLKPTLFIRGGNSDYILPSDYPLIRKNFPFAEIITIEGASHWVHAEAPEQFYLLASGFLTGKPDWYNEPL
ncbi:MAG: alpha/beta fold hydrolase [Bacteroidetes bacterium]|nr:alpha/beta fold hydrolase [Bacteroidota bacterium]